MIRKRFPATTALLLLATGLSMFVNSCNEQKPGAAFPVPPGKVNLLSSDADLVMAWGEAKAMALSYVRNDNVGLWYEASLPGRDAFCMRDVAHQSGGAAVLGLHEHTRNMLYRFAENISESKDWCSFWEITKDNKPAPVDYVNDQDFWYNLPANFDVLDACMRMFAWTGDSSYIVDPVFLNFYKRSMHDYVERWQLSADKILSRPAIMNLPEDASPESHRFHGKRGIPGYHEGGGGNMQVGIDLLAVQYAANNWMHYLHTMHSPNDSCSAWLTEARKIDSLIRNVFWDEAMQDFRIIRYADGNASHMVGDNQDFSHSLLHYQAVDDSAMTCSLLDRYGRVKGSLAIEIASHLPDIFFRHGRPEEGIAMLKHLADSATPRREYPENSFALTAAFATGLMGINIYAPEKYISSFSGLEDASAWALMEALPCLQGEISLLHEGRHTSVMQNHTSKTIYWQAFMEAGPEEWYINGEARRHEGEVMQWYGSNVVSWFVAVSPGETVSISALPA